MVRTGGAGYAIDVSKPIGQRISDMTLLASEQRVMQRNPMWLVVGHRVNEGTGPPVYDLVNDYIGDKKTVRVRENQKIRFRHRVGS